MICETCKAEGKTSRARSTATVTTTTLDCEFYDDKGHYHSHDPTKRVMAYTCSNGHQWTEVTVSYCFNCGWPDAPEPTRQPPLGTVGELIAALSKFPPDAKVVGTWEGISEEIHAVYAVEDGTVLLNVDQ